MRPRQNPALKWSPAPVVIIGFLHSGPMTCASPFASDAAAKRVGWITTVSIPSARRMCAANGHTPPVGVNCSTIKQALADVQQNPSPVFVKRTAKELHDCAEWERYMIDAWSGATIGLGAIGATALFAGNPFVVASVLALPLLTVDRTAELVHEALLTVSVQDVRSWANDSVGPSKLSKVCTLSAAVDQPTPSSSDDTDSA